MDEIIWFMGFCWFCFLGVGYGSNQRELKFLGSILGMITGLSLMGESMILALALIFSNMGLFLYEASKE